MNFEASSDVNNFFLKLSTKWDDAFYSKYFNGSDAFILSFVGNPTISATSRPILKLVSPFLDKDEEETVAPEDVVIYEVIDGTIVDTTNKFKIDKDEDGNTVFVFRTRTLGTYIISNEPAVAEKENAKIEKGRCRLCKKFVFLFILQILFFLPRNTDSSCQCSFHIRIRFYSEIINGNSMLLY